MGNRVDGVVLEHRKILRISFATRLEARISWVGPKEFARSVADALLQIVQAKFWRPYIHPGVWSLTQQPHLARHVAREVTWI